MVEWYEAYADYEDEAAPGRGRRAGGRRDRLRRRARLLLALGARGFVAAIEQATGIDVMAHPDAR